MKPNLLETTKQNRIEMVDLLDFDGDDKASYYRDEKVVNVMEGIYGVHEFKLNKQEKDVVNAWMNDAIQENVFVMMSLLHKYEKFTSNEWILVDVKIRICSIIAYIDNKQYSNWVLDAKDGEEVDEVLQELEWDWLNEEKNAIMRQINELFEQSIICIDLNDCGLEDDEEDDE